jgi:hypothetical protein
MGKQGKKLQQFVYIRSKMTKKVKKRENYNISDLNAAKTAVSSGGMTALMDRWTVEPDNADKTFELADLLAHQYHSTLQRQPRQEPT